MPGQARWRARGDRGRHGGGHEGEREGDSGPEGAQEEGCGRICYNRKTRQNALKYVKTA